MSELKSLFMLPWFPRDFMSSTRGWPLAARGAYRELLDAQWDMGELPIDPEALRNIAAATESEWAIAWPKLEPKFPINCSGRKNPKLEKVRADARLYSARKSEAGRKGGLASASKRQAVLEQALISAQANVKHQSQSQSQSLSPSQNQEKNTEARKARSVTRKRCPSDFKVTPELRQWASEKAPQVDLEVETQAFMDYEFRNGHSDWDATWRTWMRNSQKRIKPATGKKSWHPDDEVATS